MHYFIHMISLSLSLSLWFAISRRWVLLFPPIQRQWSIIMIKDMIKVFAKIHVRILLLVKNEYFAFFSTRILWREIELSKKIIAIANAFLFHHRMPLSNHPFYASLSYVMYISLSFWKIKGKKKKLWYFLNTVKSSKLVCFMMMWVNGWWPLWFSFRSRRFHLPLSVNFVFVFVFFLV